MTNAQEWKAVHLRVVRRYRCIGTDRTTLSRNLRPEPSRSGSGPSVAWRPARQRASGGPLCARVAGADRL